MTEYDIVSEEDGTVLASIHLETEEDYDLFKASAGDLGYYLREVQ